MTILSYIEGSLGYLFYNFKNHDSDLLISSPPFADIPTTLSVTSPLGPSGSHMPKEYSQFSPSDTFPTLAWEAHPNVASWVVIVQDPDVPLPFASVHGIFFNLPASRTSISDADIQLIYGGGKGTGGRKPGEGKVLVGGFKAGMNLLGSVYDGPRPILGHGAHRYVYQVIGLEEEMNFSVDVPSKKDLLKAIEGNIVVWGTWIGVYDNKWE